jgi:fimbrial isopeptide formation D2 family protein/uncharacterized repeat protein (TIGR01451 family)
MLNMMIWKNRVWFILFVFASFMVLPLEAYANRTITSVTLNGASIVSVPLGSSISAVVNVTTTNSGGAKWQSTSWRIGSGAVTCVNHGDHNNAGNYSETFSITAPATQGSYSAYFIAYENDACSSGDTSDVSITMTNAITVIDNPVPSISSISPVSQNIGGGAFVLTVNGSDFANGAVVRFAGSDRATTYVSPTQLTASIAASDLTAMGAFNITVFNPAPGGGTSNAQTFTVTPPPPSATTNAATGVTSWVATVHGTVSSNGGSSDVSFEYGLNTEYGYSVPATQSPLAADAANTAVSADLVGLNCNTTFHYRVVATNSGGTTNGLDGTFTTGACTASYPVNACAATRYGNDLNCSANDVNLTNIRLAPGSISSCVSGAPVSLDLDLTVNFASPDRWDVGIFIANDGKLPTKLPTNGGAENCSVDVLPTTAPFLDLDGVPQGTADVCGDGNGSINGGTGSGDKRMTGVTLPCYASPDSGGKLFVPFVVSWDNQKSPVGSLCKSNAYPVPNTSSKCNAPASSVAINVVVLPVITKTNGTSTINPGANTTYTIVIYNNSGGTLQDMVFTDPAVTNLTVNSVTCAAANGATCPSTSVAAMQGSGIMIPSANLPNNSTLTFTVNADVSSAAIEKDHIKNKATVTIGSSSTSAEDDDEIVISPTAMKSFAPSTITEGASSLLTIALTNPTAAPITGVSFTDTYPSGMLNTASANGTTTCGGTVTAINNGNSLALSGGTIPASGSCTVTVNINSAVAGTYTNSTGAVISDGVVSISAASAMLTVNAPIVGAFNACDVGVTCTKDYSPTISRITTKIAGSPFYLDLVELSAQQNYGKAVKVELLDSSDNQGTIDLKTNCSSSWTTVATLSTTPTFNNSKAYNVGPFTVSEAYRDMRVRVTSTSGTSMIGCSLDNFAIRPNNFVLRVTDADWQTTGTSRALNNIDLASPGSSTGISYPIHKAGQPFTVRATAQNAADGTTSNYAGTLLPVLGVCSGTACTPHLGDFPLSSFVFVSGLLSPTARTYSEVGSFNLALRDTDFTKDADAADTPATCDNVPDAQGRYGRYICGATDVGRFVPDHFDVSVDSDGTMAAGCAAGAFTYTGQTMGYGTVPMLTIKPMNAASGGSVTQNYRGDFQKLLASGISIVAPTEDAVQKGADGLTKTLLSASMSTGTLVNDGSGTMTYTLKADDAFTYTRDANALVGPYITNIPLAVSAVSDGEVSAAGTLSILSPAGVSLRYGRLSLQNAYGSELLTLPIPVEAQYWSGSYYTVNTDDSCTAFPASSIIMDNYLQSLKACETHFSPAGDLTMSGGILSPGLNLTAPGSGNTGSVDLELNIASGASGNTCTSATESSAIAANISWFGANPTARATFGIYKGNSKFIYIRELY